MAAIKAFMQPINPFMQAQVTMPKQHYVTCLVQCVHVLQLAGLRVVGGRLVLQGLYSCSLYYSWQLCVLLACMYINNLYCNHQFLASAFLNSSISFCRTLVGSLPLANNGQHSACSLVLILFLTRIYHGR